MTRQQVGWYDGSRVHQIYERPVGIEPDKLPRHLAHTAGWVAATVGDDGPGMELAEAQVAEFAAQSACRHLSALVDFERQVSERCMAVMKALMDAAEPVNNEFQDCHIDYAEYAKFVDAHAELLYVIKNGERPAAPLPPSLLAQAQADMEHEDDDLVSDHAMGFGDK